MAGKSLPSGAQPLPPPHRTQVAAAFNRSRRSSARRRAAVAGAIALAAAMAISLAAGLAGPNVSGEQHFGAELTGRVGATTTVSLQPDMGAFSPACGCADPSGVAADWHGFVVPSEGFTLHTDTTADNWMLTSVAPVLDGGFDWFAMPPARTSRFTVYVGDEVVFDGRGTYLTAIGQSDVSIQHGSRFPVLTVVPGADDEVTMSSEPGPRPGSGGTGAMTIANPARDKFNWDVEETEVEDAFRGPALDIIGPAITYTFTSRPGTKLWIGKLALPGVPQNREVRIVQHVSWSTRVMVQPVGREHIGDLVDVGKTHGTVKVMTDDGTTRVPAEISSRFVDTSAIEAYKLDITDIDMPSTADWQALADRSTDSDTRQVPSMLSASPLDDYMGLDGLIGAYGLPPITVPMAVVAHGKISSFATSAHTGQAVIDSTSTPIAYGDDLTISSDHGLDVTTFQGEPVFAASGDTGTLALSGDAELSVNGRPLTHPRWARWADSWLGLWLGGIVAVLWASIVLVHKVGSLGKTSRSQHSTDPSDI